MGGGPDGETVAPTSERGTRVNHAGAAPTATAAATARARIHRRRTSASTKRAGATVSARRREARAPPDAMVVADVASSPGAPITPPLPSAPPPPFANTAALVAVMHRGIERDHAA